MIPVWGMILSALSIGYSIIPKSHNRSQVQQSPFFLDSRRDERLFLSGAGKAFRRFSRQPAHNAALPALTNFHFPFCAVLGLGCSLLCSIISKQFRIVERQRLFWIFWWNIDDSKVLTPYRTPTPVLSATEVLQKSKDGEVRLLLSPNTASTSSLHISILSLAPESELPSQTAKGVEFYYVISGTGTFSQQGVVETSKLIKGHFFVVDYGNMRWINAKNSSENLVLLRATDGGNQYSSPQLDRIRVDPYHRAQVGITPDRFLKVLWGTSDKLLRSADRKRATPNIAENIK